MCKILVDTIFRNYVFYKLFLFLSISRESEFNFFENDEYVIEMYQQT